MKVKLLAYTPEPEKVIAIAARICYSDKADIETIAEGFTEEEISKFIKQLISTNHTSCLEHSSFSFGIEGISRVVSHELVRHRMASYCVTGDTVIPSYQTRKGNAVTKRTIKECYDIMHGDARRKGAWQANIRIRSVNEETGTIISSKIKDVFYNGQQMTYAVRTESNRIIRCTALHQFLTKEGWKTLAQLHVNDFICVNGKALLDNEEWLRHNYLELNRTRKELAAEIGCCESYVNLAFRRFNIRKPKSQYPNRHDPVGGYPQSLIQYHEPNGYVSGPEHHSYVQDRMAITSGGGHNEAWKKFHSEDEVCEFCGTDIKIEVHHIDKEPRNNDPSNIKKLCSTCHVLWHKQNAQGIFYDKIVSIEENGVTDVYDLEVEGIWHNYIANSFVVHNSQRSQRYCSEGEAEFVVPDIIADGNEQVDEIFWSSVANSLGDYKDLLREEIPKEAARYVLPNATATRMIVTMNARELRHFFALRCCRRALPEMQDLACSMLSEVKKVAPNLFKNAGASCEQLGYCPEGKRSCGLKPTLEKLKEGYRLAKKLERNSNGQ